MAAIIRKTAYIVALALIFALSGAFLSSCKKSDDLTASFLAGEISASCGNISSREYYMAAARGSSGYLGDKLLSLLYSPFDEAKSLFSEKLDDYSILLSNSALSYEIHCLKLRSESDARYAEALLHTRIKTLQNREIYLFSPEAYEAAAASAIVYKKGKWIFLLATEDNANAIKTIKNLL